MLERFSPAKSSLTAIKIERHVESKWNILPENNKQELQIFLVKQLGKNMLLWIGLHIIIRQLPEDSRSAENYDAFSSIYFPCFSIICSLSNIIFHIGKLCNFVSIAVVYQSFPWWAKILSILRVEFLSKQVKSSVSTVISMTITRKWN